MSPNKEFLKKSTKYWVIGTAIAFIALLIVSLFFLDKITNLLITFVVCLFLSLFVYWFIHYWHNNFLNEKKKEEDHENPYNKVFFGGVNFISMLLLIFGIIASVAVYFTTGNNIFKALGLAISIMWAVAFLKYFVWAVYFYNINYGLTDNDWKKIEQARIRKRNNEQVDPNELKEPKNNPYIDQTFGLPQGTVRGMIAFTLLFGAISLLVANMGNDENISENANTWDQFEFFKTAFIMMIAFYFGDRSLQYLSKKWGKSDGQQEGSSDSTGNGENQNEEQSNSTITPSQNPNPSPSAITEVKNQLATSEANNKPKEYIPIIDAGHGGIDSNGNYTTAPGKLYRFINYPINDKPFTVYEGVINRKIANKLIDLLKINKIGYYYINEKDEISDLKLPERVNLANSFYKQNKNSYLLSIHCNTASDSNEGNGMKARGFEIYTSVGQTQSDALATIAAKWYKKEFPNFKFRQELEDGDPDKESNFYVLRKTDCPAFLIENLFYDNLDDAKFLVSDEGQTKIAQCLLKIVKEINQLT